MSDNPLNSGQILPEFAPSDCGEFERFLRFLERHNATVEFRPRFDGDAKAMLIKIRRGDRFYEIQRTWDANAADDCLAPLRSTEAIIAMENLEKDCPELRVR